MAKRHAKTRVKSNEYTAVITRSSEIDLSFDSASCSTVGDLNFLEIIYVAFTFLTIMAKTTLKCSLQYVVLINNLHHKRALLFLETKTSTYM